MSWFQRILGNTIPEAVVHSEPDPSGGAIDIEIAAEDKVPEIDPALLEPSVDLIVHYHFDPTRVHDPDLSLFPAISARVFFESPPLFLDIGANMGNTLASLTALGCQFPVESFEINPALHERLRIAAGIYGDAKVHTFGLGPREETCWLFVPVLKDMFVLGEATLDLDFIMEEKSKERMRAYLRGETLKVGKVPVTIRTLDSLGLAPQLIKIDVEGVEDQVIAGGIETLRRHRPLFMAENSYPEKVRAALEPLGYEAYQFDQETKTLRRQHTLSQNTFWAEERWQERLRGAGLLTG